MRKSVILIQFASIMFILWSPISYADDAVPNFSDFYVKETFKGAPATVDITSHLKARRFQTVLRDGAKSGPNFADHFTVVTWGCGTACEEFAIINAKTGKVYFPSSIRFNAYQMVHDETEPFQYRKDSSLFIVAGSPDEEEDLLGLFYYKWTGSDLKLIHEVKRHFEPAE